MNESGLSEDERTYYKDFLAANTEVFKPSDGSREEFQKYLGSPVETPLGQVRMGANQYSKFIEKKRGSLFIAARETLERPLLIFKAENGTVVYVKSFASEDDYPRRDKVTGGWYIGDVIGYYGKTDGQMIFSVLACCLCKGEDGLEDYYGLNHFFELEDGELTFGSYDSMTI